MAVRIFLDENKRNIRDEVVDSYSTVLRSTEDLHGNPNNVVGFAVYTLSDVAGVPVEKAIDYVTENIFAGSDIQAQQNIAGGIAAFALNQPGDVVRALLENYESFVQEGELPSIGDIDREAFDFLGDQDIIRDLDKAAHLNPAMAGKIIMNRLYGSGGDVFSGDTSTGDKSEHSHHSTLLDKM